MNIRWEIEKGGENREKGETSQSCVYVVAKTGLTERTNEQVMRTKGQLGRRKYKPCKLHHHHIFSVTP